MHFNWILNIYFPKPGKAAASGWNSQWLPTSVLDKIRSSEPRVHPQTSIKALNAKLHNIHKERWQPSIKKVFVATEITLSATGKPAGVPADLRAANEIRMSKSHAHHSANDTQGKKKKKTSLTQAREGGPKRLISSADKTMPILTCGWMWLSCYQEGPLRGRWEEPEFEC